jgi:hypothetical protein
MNRARLAQAVCRWSVLGLLVLAGCAGSPVARELDPLIGGAPLPREPAATRPVRGDARAELPPLPPALSPTSPAALTTGATGAGLDRRATETNVTLGSPRAAERAGVRASTVTAPSRGVTPAAAVVPASPEPSYEQLQQQLRARGVVWQQLRSGESDEWHFICAVPHPEQPRLRRNYEARAAGPNGLAAIRAALAEIDRDRAGGP